MNIATAWPEKSGDDCADFFGTALRAFHPHLRADAAVLEIGCAEYNWLSPAHAAWPNMTLTGIDWRGWKVGGAVLNPPFRVVKGDAMDADAFAADTFDWIVSISAIEHMGLGHYHADPKAEGGDSRVMRNALRWLTPGGLMYLDVPWNTGCRDYEVVGTSHRVYDDATIASRLTPGFEVRWRGVVDKKRTTTLLANPPRKAGGEDFYYLGLWLQKPGGPHGTTT